MKIETEYYKLELTDVREIKFTIAGRDETKCNYLVFESQKEVDTFVQALHTLQISMKNATNG